MENIVEIVKSYGPVITIGLGVLSATPPVYKAWVKPILILLRDAIFRDKFEKIENEMEVMRKHRQSRSLHLNREQQKLLKDLSKEKELP